MSKKNRRLLQLFAEGTQGSASTGEAGAAAGRDAGDTGAPAQTQNIRAQEQAAAATEKTAPRLTWEQIKEDPEYNRCMQAMIQARLKDAKQARQDLEQLAPVLEAVAESCNVEAGDYPGMVEAVARRRAETAQNKARRDSALLEHFRSLQTQATALREKYPEFDLARELEDPTFLRLTAPDTGVSLEQAYYTVHRDRIEAKALRLAAQRTADRISGAIRAGALRPVENGAAGAAPSVTVFDYRTATPAQREALKKRIRLAGTRGEKLYPGSM